MSTVSGAGLRTLTFVIEGDINTEFTLSEQADGTIKVDVSITDSALIGDLRGVFFDISADWMTDGITITGDDVTAYVTDEDGVKKVSNSVNINGEILNTYGKFDVGVEFGTNGISNDDIQSTSFTIASADGPLSLDLFEAQDFALRYTSVGEEDGARDGSLKIGGESELLGSIGDRVWIDADMDGIQDAEEIGLAGAEVRLLKDGIDTGITAITDANGAYLFDMIEAGTYSIQVAALPEDYVFTLQGTGGGAVDSDVDATGLSDMFVLAEGEDRTDIDAGVYDMGAVSEPPVLEDDAAQTCWTDARTIAVLANDEDGATITAIDGVAVTAGAAVTLASGAQVILNADGTLTYDVGTVWTGSLEFGAMAADSFTYTAANADGEEATASVEMMICADNARSVEDIALMLPETVAMTVYEGDVQDAFSADIASPGFARLDMVGADAVYCIDFEGAYLDGVTLDTAVFLADPDDAGLAPHVAAVENLDNITWILNQDWGAQGYSDATVQNAIWMLSDPGALFDFLALDIVNQASVLGEGFEAGEGDLVGLVLAPLDANDPGFDFQTMIVGVAYDSFAECLCM